MAKGKDSGLPPVGEDTEKYLEEAKKGKPRNFLLVCKGPSVVFLAVKKKSVKKAELVEAKKQGYKGEPYFGTITGKGLDLAFNLARTDGYEAEPVKAKALKDFLAEELEFLCKPSFVIVDEPIQLPFEEEDLNNPVVLRFQKTEAAVRKAAAGLPNLAEAFHTSLAEIRDMLLDRQFDSGNKLIDQLVAELKSALTSPRTAAGASVTSSDAASDVSNRQFEATQKLRDTFEKFQPLIQNVETTGGESAQEISHLVISFQQLLEQGDANNAKTALLTLGKRLKELSAQADVRSDSASTSPQFTPQQLQFEQQWSALESRANDLIKQKLGDTSRMSGLLGYASEKSASGDYASALKALDGLRILVDRASSGQDGKLSDVIRPGLVAERKKFLLSRWQDSVRRIYAEIENLRSLPVSEVPTVQTLALIAGLKAWLAEFVDGLDKAILSAQQSSDENGSSLEQARKVIEDFKKKVATDPLMQHLSLAKQQVGVTINLQEVLLDTLIELQAKLESDKVGAA